MVPIQNINRVIAYTNVCLKRWYQNARRDYGVNGFGECFWDGKNIVIVSTENGVTRKFSSPFYSHERMEYYFNVWMES
ncbi:MAG: hypothetical protein RBR97_20790 [Bacteroidales bacterium]|nr:hypothetical protein [Bacteroidales bacterium]